MQIDVSPFQLVYGKPCHLSIEMENISYLAFKILNMNLNCVGNDRLLSWPNLKSEDNTPMIISSYIKKSSKHIMANTLRNINSKSRWTGLTLYGKRSIFQWGNQINK